MSPDLLMYPSVELTYSNYFYKGTLLQSSCKFFKMCKSKIVGIVHHASKIKGGTCVNVLFLCHDSASTILRSGDPREEPEGAHYQAHCSPSQVHLHNYKCYPDRPTLHSSFTASSEKICK